MNKKIWIVKRNGLVTKLLTINQGIEAYRYFTINLKFENVELINIHEYLRGL
jgi:hypothetical protein